MSAEIGKALQIILNKEIHYAMIISDSLSALEKIKNDSFNSNPDILYISIMKLIHKVNSAELNIICKWVPNHSYIVHNDTADMLANKGRGMDIPIAIKGGPEEP
ncbi:hypothetical protein HHI36_001378 [Cryptolaemus montrouzieri]|uniref:RNase H type-1 domain-containing protein n=1 Tax=Cryptolaemus montrouzieri TaxID=559131 RepID=A0ABD2P7G1_9CUCU